MSNGTTSKPLDEARNGNLDGIMQFAMSFLPLLRAEAAARLSPGAATASDVVQSGLRVACERIADFRGTTLAEWRGWVRRIVRNRALAESRRPHRRQAVTEVEMVPSQEPQVSERMEQSQQVDAIRVAMTRLSSEDQLIIELKTLHEMSYPDIAVALGIAENAARKRWERAVRRLRALVRSADE